MTVYDSKYGTRRHNERESVFSQQQSAASNARGVTEAGCDLSKGDPILGTESAIEPRNPFQSSNRHVMPTITTPLAVQNAVDCRQVSVVSVHYKSRQDGLGNVLSSVLFHCTDENHKIIGVVFSLPSKKSQYWLTNDIKRLATTDYLETLLRKATSFRTFHSNTEQQECIDTTTFICDDRDKAPRPALTTPTTA